MPSTTEPQGLLPEKSTIDQKQVFLFLVSCYLSWFWIQSELVPERPLRSVSILDVFAIFCVYSRNICNFFQRGITTGPPTAIELPDSSAASPPPIHRRTVLPEPFAPSRSCPPDGSSPQPPQQRQRTAASSQQQNRRSDDPTIFYNWQLIFRSANHGQKGHSCIRCSRSCFEFNAWKGVWVYWEI